MSPTSRARVVCALLLWLFLSDARVTSWRDGAPGRQSDTGTFRPHQLSTVEEGAEFQGGLLQLQAQLVLSDESFGALEAPAPGPESPPSPPPSSESDPVPPPPQPVVPPPQPLSPPEPLLPPPPSGQLPAEDEPSPPQPLSPPEVLPSSPEVPPSSPEVPPSPPEVPPSPPEVPPSPSAPLPHATLAFVTLDGGKLVPAFAENCWNYVLLVPYGTIAVRITVFLAKGDEDFVVKLEGIPLANGIESPPMAINDEAGKDVQSLRITVTAIAHHPTTYILHVERDYTSSTSHLLLVIFLWFLGLAAAAFLIYGFYLYVIRGRERGWWPFRYYLRETALDSSAGVNDAREPLLQ